MDAYASGRQMSIMAVDKRTEEDSSKGGRILLWPGGAETWCGVLLLPGSFVWHYADAAFAERYLGKSVQEMLEEAAKEPSALKLDISEMPEGVIRFHTGIFLKKAESVIGAGNSTDSITLGNAGEWGYIAEEQSP